MDYHYEIDYLVDMWTHKRELVETMVEVDEAYRTQDDEENPFLDQALIDEAKSGKKKAPGQKKQRAIKED